MLPAAASEDHAGQLFAGRYMMRRRIGSGGMSTIHEAQDTHLGSRVAVKVMRGDLPSDPVDRFRREAHVLARLVHEHIAHILDRQDPETGPRFLITEYIDGPDLSVLRRRGPVPGWRTGLGAEPSTGPAIPPPRPFEHTNTRTHDGTEGGRARFAAVVQCPLVDLFADVIR